MGKSTILFACSEEFKDCLGTYAASKKMSVSEVIRLCVAKEIDYDLSKEPIVDGRRKYANADERKEEQRKRQKRERDNLRKLLEAFGTEQRLHDIEILEKSLKNRE